jgi:membrane-associated phospholipid phosphatase
MKNAVMKPLYLLSGKKDIFLLGLGYRPTGARSCSLHLDGELSTSFGMPSGHSQMIWMIGTYLLSKIISKLVNDLNNRNEMTTRNKMTIIEKIIMYGWIAISIFSILAIMIYVSYSRVYIEGCHTLEQIIVGAIIGGIIGFLGYYFEERIIKAIKTI